MNKANPLGASVTLSRAAAKGLRCLNSGRFGRKKQRRALSVTTCLALVGLALLGLAWGGGRSAHAAPTRQEATPAEPGAASTDEPTDVPAPTPTVPAWASGLPLTTTTVSLYKGNECSVWGETVGSSPTATVTAGPVLVSYSLFSHYTETPHHEYKYLFAMRVGDTLAVLTVNGEPLTTIYRGELRIEYVPVPVSKRYSYATYGLAHLEPGVYDLAGTWRLASGEKDGPRKCRLVVTP